MEQTITLTFTTKEADAILNSLYNPIKDQLNLIAKIKEEAQKQLNPQSKSEVVEEEKKD